MIEQIQEQVIKVTSPDWTPLSKHLSNKEGSLDAFLVKSLEANNEQRVHCDLIACVRHNHDGRIDIRMPTLCGHPLYICEHEGRTYLSDHVVAFYHLGLTAMDEIYLAEMAQQGFSIQHKTLLKNVRSLYANEQYACKSEQLVWLNNLLPSISSENKVSDAPFDKIPGLSLRLFSPLDHILYVDAWIYLQTTEDSSIKINENELRKCLNIHHNDLVSAMGSLGKKTCKKMSKQEWLQDEIWQKHCLPFIKSQLTAMAYEHNKKLVWSLDPKVSLPWNEKVLFEESDKPIHNLFEAFQRLFFYGNKWLVKQWLFIPPLISAKLVLKRKGNAHRVFLYATSLDYLMRFHTLNHETPTE